MQTTIGKNGFIIRYSKRHDDWVVLRHGVTIQEFSSRQDAIAWAEDQKPKGKDLALKVLNIVKHHISDDVFNECLDIINNN